MQARTQRRLLHGSLAALPNFNHTSSLGAQPPQHAHHPLHIVPSLGTSRPTNPLPPCIRDLNHTFHQFDLNWAAAAHDVRGAWCTIIDEVAAVAPSEKTAHIHYGKTAGNQLLEPRSAEY